MKTLLANAGSKKNLQKMINDFYSLEDDINNFFEELEEEEEYLINKNLIDRKL